MKINVAKSAGFCFGVKRAITIAYETLKSKNKVYILSDIVHNEDIAQQMNKAGLKKIRRLTRVKDKILLMPAHGTSKETSRKAKALGYHVIDATCPMVKEIHKIAIDLEKQGYKIIIIGDHNHSEVQGIIGQLQHKVIIIDSIKNIPLNKIKNIKRSGIIVQSTQNLDKTLAIVDVLKSHIKDLKFYNTICQPTRTKQLEIKRMPIENDVMIIIGSKTSANTKRLYEISKSLNKRSYWVQSKNKILRKWFENAKSVGITAGASTPDSTTQEIIKHIKNIYPSIKA